MYKRERGVGEKGKRKDKCIVYLESMGEGDKLGREEGQGGDEGREQPSLDDVVSWRWIVAE